MWVALGDRAIRFPRPAASARTIVRAARAWPGVVGVLVAARDVAVYFADAPVTVDPDRIRALDGAVDDAEPAREVALRAIYDGPDLEEVASTAGLSVAEVVSLHGSTVY